MDSTDLEQCVFADHGEVYFGKTICRSIHVADLEQTCVFQISLLPGLFVHVAHVRYTNLYEKSTHSHLFSSDHRCWLT